MRTYKDISGQKFGYWEVIERVYLPNTSKIWYRCKCLKCGKEYNVRSDPLFNGRSKSCKHCASLIDLSGKTFGNWLVIKYIGQTKSKASQWLCRCLLCNKEKIVLVGNLTSGKSTACRKCGIKDGHKMSHTRLYNIYRHMITRCYCNTCDCYSDYGGRGITICKEWKENFLSFVNWSLNNGYSENLTIDRIDVNKGYSPENCRWTTLEEQQRTHKRRLIELTFKGQTKCITEWSRILNISQFTISRRLKKGWSVERTLSTPPLTGKNAKTWKSPS